MAKRVKLGLTYSYKKNWIGGTYYILNIIHALNTVDDSVKPELYIFTESYEDYEKLVEETKYPFIKYCSLPIDNFKYNFFEKGINKIWRKLLNRNLISKYKGSKVDVLYPAPLPEVSNTLKKVYWIPDFQECHLPQFFSEEELSFRKSKNEFIASRADIVVFSSEDAQKDYQQFFPKSGSKSLVLRFAVTHPDLSHLKFESLKRKYSISKDYFFVANQFWAHKNHMIILKALLVLKERGVKAYMVMSGSQSDYRNKDHFAGITNFIESNGLTEQINLVGFIPREDQLCLLQHSKSVIQPSLFEGWSTVVEDAKALNTFSITSNLNVHKEQLKNNVIFFDPLDPIELADAIENVLLDNCKVENMDYSIEINRFGNEIVELINLAVKA